VSQFSERIFLFTYLAQHSQNSSSRWTGISEICILGPTNKLSWCFIAYLKSGGIFISLILSKSTGGETRLSD